MRLYIRFFFVIALLVNSTFSFGQIETQRAQNWCWAACIQSLIYQSSGQKYSQISISRDLDGWPQDRPAHIIEVISLLKYYGFSAWRAGRPGTPEELYTLLTSGWKLIAFVRPTNSSIAHFIVLQGADMYGNIIVSDPAFGLTVKNSLNDLYFSWKWEDSIIVGR